MLIERIGGLSPTVYDAQGAPMPYPIQALHIWHIDGTKSRRFSIQRDAAALWTHKLADGDMIELATTSMFSDETYPFWRKNVPLGEVAGSAGSTGGVGRALNGTGQRLLMSGSR